MNDVSAYQSDGVDVLSSPGVLVAHNRLAHNASCLKRAAHELGAVRRAHLRHGQIPAARYRDRLAADRSAGASGSTWSQHDAASQFVREAVWRSLVSNSPLRRYIAHRRHVQRRLHVISARLNARAIAVARRSGKRPRPDRRAGSPTVTGEVRLPPVCRCRCRRHRTQEREQLGQLAHS